MVKASGIAWNRLPLLINFYSDTALLIPIHGLCVAGKKKTLNTFFLIFAWFLHLDLSYRTKIREKGISV